MAGDERDNTILYKHYRYICMKHYNKVRTVHEGLMFSSLLDRLMPDAAKRLVYEYYKYKWADGIVENLFINLELARIN